MPKPSLYIVRQDLNGDVWYIASTFEGDDVVECGRFSWTGFKSRALRTDHSTARRLAGVAVVETGREALVLPAEMDLSL